MIKFIGKVYKGNMLRKYKKIPSSIQNIVTIYLNENKFTCFWETLEKRSPKLATGTQIAVHGSITHKVKRRPKLWNFYNARCCQTCYNDNFTVLLIFPQCYKIAKQTSESICLLFNVSNSSFFPIFQLISFLQHFLSVSSQWLFSLPLVVQAQQLVPP